MTEAYSGISSPQLVGAIYLDITGFGEGLTRAQIAEAPPNIEAHREA